MLRLTDPLVLPLVAPPVRDAVASLWALDARLAELARAGREPALRQIRLAWWSEQLAKLDRASLPAEPVLQSVGTHLLDKVDREALAGLADAWVAEALDDGGWEERGAHVFRLTGELLGKLSFAEQAGRGWAIVERGLAGSEVDWTAAAATLDCVRLADLPRPLAAVTAVARRIARHDGMRASGREQALLFRVGLFGR